MCVDLVELLRTRTISHPSRFVAIESRCAAEVRISIAGFQWWLENPQADKDGAITFCFEGISDCSFDADMIDSDPTDEDLDTFDISRLSELPWSKGTNCDIYSSGPIPTPLNVYATLHDFLLSAGCPFGPERYLNKGYGGSLREFSEIAASNSFHLCRGPEGICDVVCAEMKRVGTGFNVIKGKDLSGGLIFVRIAQSYLICQSASATFEG